MIKTLDLPSFITKKARIKPRKKKPSTFGPAAGDTGTPELKQRMLEADLALMSPSQLAQYRTAKGKDMKVGVAFEARSRSSTGQATEVGARVESQLPHDRYKARGELDPLNAWRNLVLWEAAERLRTDFYLTGIAAKMCSTFEPRIKGGGDMRWEADKQVDALARYKKAMKGIGGSLRPVLYYVCIAGNPANEWASRNGMVPQAGLPVLRLALADLATHYGYIRAQQENFH